MKLAGKVKPLFLTTGHLQGAWTLSPLTGELKKALLKAGNSLLEDMSVILSRKDSQNLASSIFLDGVSSKIMDPWFKDLLWRATPRIRKEYQAAPKEFDKWSTQRSNLEYLVRKAVVDMAQQALSMWRVL
jgi:hypothetical protein